MRFYTPLRYPGGKQKLAPFIRDIVTTNRLEDCHYIEPYAGGAGVALGLLYRELASDVYLNDLDPAVYSFWYCVIHKTEELIERIREARISMVTWKRCRATYCSRQREPVLDLAFATFFLNRTNRSGIIRGGVIGGQRQTGRWKLDARFNKDELIDRIRRVAAYKDRIHLSNLDATFFIQSIASRIEAKTFIYLDPPYYAEGCRLYRNHYKAADHKLISDLVKSGICRNWIVSYDNVAQVRQLYSGCKQIVYDLNHSAHQHHFGSEIMFFAEHLAIPAIPTE